MRWFFSQSASFACTHWCAFERSLNAKGSSAEDRDAYVLSSLLHIEFISAIRHRHQKTGVDKFISDAAFKPILAASMPYQKFRLFFKKRT
jgi:hypothetical protein